MASYTSTDECAPPYTSSSKRVRDPDISIVDKRLKEDPTAHCARKYYKACSKCGVRYPTFNAKYRWYYVKYWDESYWGWPVCQPCSDDAWRTVLSEEPNAEATCDTNAKWEALIMKSMPEKMPKWDEQTPIVPMPHAG